MSAVCLDYNASTPIDPAVQDVMRPLLEGAYGNPSSGHWASAGAKAALETARAGPLDHSRRDRPGGGAFAAGAVMTADMGPAVIGSNAYVAWRETSLGAITETLELRAMLDLMGERKGARVLDVGCGDGLLACSAAARGALATGVDANPAMLAAARDRAEESVVKASFLEGRIERLPFSDGAFDLVSAVTALCLVVDAEPAFREMARVLRPGGRLVAGELGRWSLWAAIRRLRAWFGSPFWRSARFRDADELERLAEQARLSVQAIRGVAFYPPVGFLARIMAPLDPWLGRRTTLGAAFIALRAAAVQDCGSH